ncbi:hypothetical protein F5Y18DRAFT_420313 [Xylariaceae sp. FL1019]|nr:hypothetical protein F5Y18DRAFT_420313 [Xylariaceae sp. FL1019]
MEPAPEFHDYYPIPASQIILATILLTLCVCGVSVRSYTRAVIIKMFDPSDWALILALAIFVALKLVANTYGQGHHQWDVNVVTIQDFLFMQNLLEMIYSLAVLFAKYTVLRQIELIFYKHRHENRASRVILGLVWANSIFYVAAFFLSLFACVPRAKIWNPEVDGRCIHIHASILATSVVNVVSDTTILIIPIVAIWQLQLRTKAKFGISVVFAVGIFATAAAIIRLYYGVDLTRSGDTTWLIEGVGTWAIIEIATVILVACFPLFPRFYKHFVKGDEHQPFQLMGTDHRGDGKETTADSHGYVIMGDGFKNYDIGLFKEFQASNDYVEREYNVDFLAQFLVQC